MTPSTRVTRRITTALSNRKRPLVVELEGRVLRFREQRTRKFYSLDVATAFRFAVEAEIRQKKEERLQARHAGIRGNRR